MLAAIIGDPYRGSRIVFFAYFDVTMICARALRVSRIGRQMATEYPNRQHRRIRPPRPPRQLGAAPVGRRHRGVSNESPHLRARASRSIFPHPRPSGPTEPPG